MAFGATLALALRSFSACGWRSGDFFGGLIVQGYSKGSGFRVFFSGFRV